MSTPEGYAYLRRLAAFHEAGHASMLWFFHCEQCLTGIEMDGMDGITLTSRFHPELTVLTGAPSRVTKANGTMLVMYALAGLSAESNCDEENDIWITRLSEDLEYVDCSRQIPLDSEDDLPSALAVAQRLFGLNKRNRVVSFLEECAVLTQTAVTNELAPLIQALAPRLIQTDRVSGTDAVRIMGDVWQDSNHPIDQDKWRVRFRHLDRAGLRPSSKRNRL